MRYLGKNTASLQTVKFFPLPRLSHWHRLSELNVDELVQVHVKRKQARYPILKKQQWMSNLLYRFYYQLEKCRASYYFQLFSQHPATTIVLWNGMKQPNKTPFTVAKACGKETLLFENGLLPNTTVLDPRGVNANNSLPRHSEFYREYQPQSGVEDKNLVVRQPHKNRKIKDSEIELPERYVFVPFQVPNDTQVVCHSPWVDSMEAFYEKVETALNFLQQQSDWQPYKFVIKEHPSWPKSFTELHHKNPNIVFANNNNTQDLIENALAVVTINSTVGIESLLLENKLITVGNCFYNVDGVATHCENQEQLNQALLSVEQQPFNQDLVTKFLAYLKEEYLIPGAWNKLQSEEVDNHFATVKQRLQAPYQPF